MPFLFARLRGALRRTLKRPSPTAATFAGTLAYRPPIARQSMPGPVTDRLPHGVITAMEQSRKQMLDTIETETRLTAAYTGHATISARVMAALASVERADFVPEAARRYAYENGPLPIGFGQTISQPFIVALMTDLLAIAPDHRVLDIGTGSGYQTAVLSRLAQQVYTLERIATLAASAIERLHRLGHHNVEGQCGNGWLGWPEKAPFDRIIVTAAAPEIPPALLEQLQPGGRMVIPLGEPYGYQQLTVIDKAENGGIASRKLLGVAFVPLVNANSTD